jgi:hypothetical protein
VFARLLHGALPGVLHRLLFEASETLLIISCAQRVTKWVSAIFGELPIFGTYVANKMFRGGISGGTH